MERAVRKFTAPAGAAWYEAVLQQGYNDGMKTMDFTELTPRVVLGVAAHPDDLDFSAAGTMARFARAGADVHYLILTDGSKGSSDPDESPERLTSVRRAEQLAALRAVGGRDVYYLDYCDGELEISMGLKRDIVRYIRLVRPDVVVTMDPRVLYSPGRGFINHPDHRAAGQATLDAVYPLARDHLSFGELAQEGLAPHKVTTVLLANFDEGNYCVDITETFDAKCAALAAHASQMPDIQAIQKVMREIAASFGPQAGCELAEAFVRIDVR